MLYKPVQGGWNGSEEDKHRLLEELERLRKDPSILTHDAMLPELNNEFASVSPFEPLFYFFLCEIGPELAYNL